MKTVKGGGVPLYKRTDWEKCLDESKIDMGLVPDFTQDDLDHSLFEAVREENVPAIIEMIEAGANVNMSMKPQDGMTTCGLLHIAALSTNYKVAEALLECGANPLRLDSNGLTPRDYAMKRWHNSRVKATLKRWEKRITDPVNDDAPVSFAAISGARVSMQG